MKCPDNWKPQCTCSMIALAPDDDCYIHGTPDTRVCPYCKAFKSFNKPCKRCGYMDDLEALVANLEAEVDALKATYEPEEEEV